MKGVVSSPRDQLYFFPDLSGWYKVFIPYLILSFSDSAFSVVSLCFEGPLSFTMAPYFNTDYLMELFVPASSAFVAFLFWIIFQFVFKLDFECPCDPRENTHVCVVYMTFPAISLCIVVMIADKSIRSIFCRNGTGIQWKSIILVMSLIKAFSVVCLWIITLLIDGDWYVCLATTNYTLPPYEQSFCKILKTPAEAADIRTKKSLSRVSMLFISFKQCTLGLPR